MLYIRHFNAYGLRQVGGSWRAACMHYGPRGIGGITDTGSGRSTTINPLADFLIALSRKSGLKPIYAALKREISKIAVG